jgi:hypothetical protein
MHKPGLSPSVIIIALLSLSLSLCSNTLYADQEAISDDGREVLLRADGTWSFRSTDRFAKTEDGKRIRLKQDGSWQYAENTRMISNDRVKTTELGITLRKTVIEKHEIKVQKNKRARTQTVFYLDLELSPIATSGITFSDNDASRIEVTDNSGKNYPVLTIQHNTTVLEAGSNTTIAVRVEGSPTWLDNADSMRLTFKRGIFGISEPIRLSQNIDDIEEIDVDGFDLND